MAHGRPTFCIKSKKRGSERAIADYDRAIKLKSRLALAYQNRGLAWLLLGREAEAEKDFALCLTLDSRSKLAIEQLIKETKERMRESGKR